MSDAPELKPALSISGASCQGCAKKIRNALEPLTGRTELVGVDIEAQTVALPDGVDLAEAARVVTEAGYPAEPLATSEPASCCASKKASSCNSQSGSTHTPTKPAEESVSTTKTADDDQVALSVSGATCASCVASIEKALLSVPGVIWRITQPRPAARRNRMR
jgi:Cu+-exporting ATPase